MNASLTDDMIGGGVGTEVHCKSGSPRSQAPARSSSKSVVDKSPCRTQNSYAKLLEHHEYVSATGVVSTCVLACHRRPAHCSANGLCLLRPVVAMLQRGHSSSTQGQWHDAWQHMPVQTCLNSACCCLESSIAPVCRSAAFPAAGATVSAQQAKLRNGLGLESRWHANLGQMLLCIYRNSLT